MEYVIHLAILIGIYLILAQSYNLSFGLGNLLNLAHVSAYAIGAYTTALLATEIGQSPWICFPASMTTAAFFALLIGAISLKLTQDYFALGTLAFSAIVSALLINWKSLTHGILGIPGIPRPEFLGVDFYDNANFLALTYAFAIISLIFLRYLFGSRFARALRAQSENIYASYSLNIAVNKLCNDCFIISSAFAGLAGALFAYYINYIDPTSFSLTEMIFVLSIVVVGRPSSYWGVVCSSIFLVLLPEPLRFIDFDPSLVGPMRQLLYSLILFIVLFWKREHLFPVRREI